MVVLKIRYHHDCFIIKMHYISCFLNLLEENNWNSYYYDLCKNKSKPTEGSLQKQQKTQRLDFGGTPEQTQWFASIHLTKGGHSDPTNKDHAVNSVYDIFSIQVYITFLSIQVHIIIHNVLLCFFRSYLFQFKVLVNFGSQLLFFSISVKHSCKMSTLLCVSEGRGWWVVVVCGGVQLHNWSPRSLKSSTQTRPFPPHIRS